MGILRTDIISHSQLEGSGSVEFDGDGDSLTFTATGGLSLDTDFTIEFYIYNNTIALDTQHPSPVTMPAESGAMSQIYTNSSNNYYGLYKQADIVTTGNNSALTGVWQHVAFTRKGSICFAFLDGVLKNTAVSSVTFGGTSGTYRLGSYNGSGGDVNGFISNLRIIKRAIYTTNFTVPKFELKNILKVINQAGQDENLKAIYLEVDELRAYYTSALKVADALYKARENGKEIIAFTSGLGTTGYLMASQATEIILEKDSYESVLPFGFSRVRQYQKDFFKNIKVDVNVYAAGDFKSGPEGFTRNNMSTTDKLAWLEFATPIWEKYKSKMEIGREFESGKIQYCLLYTSPSPRD
mgnify:CR=1 FL=1